MLKLDNLKNKFKNKDLFDQALTHKSWVNENGTRESNERLEFLGDAVLELVVTGHLYETLPDKPEGYLTALRANIVNTANLSKLARSINLAESIYLSKGESESGKKNNSLLADTVEALIGAIYLDQGQKEAQKFISENLLHDLEEKIKEPLKDPKSMLQEYFQSNYKTTPVYKVIKEIGPDNAKEFTIRVQSGGKSLGEGTGTTKQEAQQKAAAIALRKLK